MILSYLACPIILCCKYLNLLKNTYFYDASILPKNIVIKELETYYILKNLFLWNRKRKLEYNRKQRRDYAFSDFFHPAKVIIISIYPKENIKFGCDTFKIQNNSIDHMDLLSVPGPISSAPLVSAEFKMVWIDFFCWHFGKKW